jgi:hypothetical protein
MPMFVQLFITGAQFYVLGHLGLIERCEAPDSISGILEDVPGNPTIKRLTYKKKSSGPGQDRVHDLCNSVSTNVVLIGVDRSFVLPGNIPITAVGGITLPFDGTAIRVIYDVTAAGDSNYYVHSSLDPANRISYTGPVLLFHELSHAFHIAVGDAPASSSLAERQAIEDENAFRFQIGLPLRSLTDHSLGIGLAVTDEVRCPAGIEPELMPLEGGLRMRVSTDSHDAHVGLTIGSTPAIDVSVRDKWVYGTAPALAAGSHIVTLVQGGQASTVGNIVYTAALVPSVRAAVGSYLVSLRELAAQLTEVTNDQVRAKLGADRDMRANAVDTAIHIRAEATGDTLELPSVDEIWLAVAGTFELLEKQIGDDHLVA